MIRPNLRAWILSSLVLTMAGGLHAQGILKKGDRVAITGDSITEQKLYSKYMETYLTACVPQLELSCMQFGWSGERAPGLAGRMENDLLPWKPSVVTTCYGMNDGSYGRYTEAIGKTYGDALRKIVETLKAAGATVVVGSPGVVDSFTWRPSDPEFDVIYNENLGQLREIARGLATEFGCPFADVYGSMMDAMTRAKAVLQDSYHVAGGDGVHPAPNGHIVMAYAFLRAMGLDGELGTIVADMAGQASGSPGHTIVSAADGTLEIESTRYPFCFSGDNKSPNSTASILPFVPFQADLNRLTLKVTGLTSPRADVQWGEAKKTFTRDELEQGVNLAAEFLDNPFCAPFEAVMGKVAQKQAFETAMIKGMVTNFRSLNTHFKDDAEYAAARDALLAKLSARQAEFGAAVRAAVVPVRHRLVIRPAAAADETAPAER